jgi:prophage regulatory protein
MSNPAIDRRTKKGFLRIDQVLELLPIGKSTVWLWVRTGRIPPPVKLGPHTTVWYRQDIEDVIATAGEKGYEPSGVKRKARSPASGRQRKAQTALTVSQGG